MSSETKRPAPSATRQKLLDAATSLMRRHGFAATRVDRICEEAGVTKGAFFHYFKSKEAIGEAAVDEWCRCRAELYFQDMGDPEDDPLLRFHRWLDGLIESIRDPGEQPVCLLGMISHELAGTHERMREICEARLNGWTGLAAQLLAAAKQRHPPRVDFDPVQVGWMLNSIWQGSLLIAKTRAERSVVADNLTLFRQFVDEMFGPVPAMKKK